MGRVYLGRDTRLDRPVAIKVIIPDSAGRRGDDTEGSLRERFADEARLGANLAHPAIATVFDYGFHDGHPFTVFEYIPGETLRDLLRRRGPLPLEEVRLILGPLAQALDFAHARHIVHRDLKPDNIRATEQGLFKILDLGLARDFLRHSDWSGFAGTPAYAAPEQAAGLPCDGRADQYALAVIAFELLTGAGLSRTATGSVCSRCTGTPSRPHSGPSGPTRPLGSPRRWPTRCGRTRTPAIPRARRSPWRWDASSSVARPPRTRFSSKAFPGS